MTGKCRFDEQLAALDKLRQQPARATMAPLRKALGHRNNYVVAKAADLVREFGLAELVPELLATFDRFFSNPLKTDPQCWAKNAVSRALAAFEHHDAEVFLRGMRHKQPEPVWGGNSDTAGTLRATCALALVQCRGLLDTDLLTHLIELLVDEEKSVRVEAARAIELVGSPSAALLLRLRAILAKDEPEILGACYHGILRIDGAAAIPWISRFLAAGDDAAGEAAFAIADDRSPQAFDALRDRFLAEHDPWFQSVLLSAIGLTRQPAALEFLFDLIRKESGHTEAAIEAVVRSMPAPDVIAQLKQIVSGNPRLARALDRRQPLG
jgi:HEAT repeat protein